VKLMNGQLTFKSLPGEGSLFQFTLPLGLQAASPNCDTLSCCPKQQWKAVEREKLRGMHVVLIDNHPVRQVKKVHILDLMSVVINWRQLVAQNELYMFCFFLSIVFLFCKL